MSRSCSPSWLMAGGSWLSKCRAFLITYYAMMVEYRAEIVLWAIATCLPLIMMGVWAEAGASGHFSVNRVQVVRYFIAVFFVRQFTVVWVIHDFEWHVVSGRLSPFLLQPIDPAWRFYFAHLGEQLARIPVALVLFVLCFFLYPEALWGDAQQPGWWHPGVLNVLLMLAALHLSFILRFWMDYAMSVGAFWFERISAAHGLIYLPYMFLSGMVFPLQVLPDVLPGWVFTLVMWTPFPYMIWFPAELVAGKGMSAGQIAWGFAMLIGWCVAMYALSRWAWRVGLKHYSAMGA